MTSAALAATSAGISTAAAIALHRASSDRSLGARMSIGDHVTSLGVQHHVRGLMQQRTGEGGVVAAIEHDHRQFVEIQTHTAHLVDSDLAAAGRERRTPVVSMAEQAR